MAAWLRPHGRIAAAAATQEQLETACTEKDRLAEDINSIMATNRDLNKELYGKKERRIE